LSREPEPAASPQLRPSLPRADSDFFFARARRRAPTVDGLREEADEDAMVDTRLLLMLKYPDDKAPLRERVALRYSALRYHVRRLLRDATRVSGAARDALIIFSAWVAVAAAEGYRPGAAKQATIDATVSGGDDDGHQQTTSAALFFALFRAAKESEIPNFKGSYLGRFPLVSADFWTSDHLSERSRSVDAFPGTRARGTLTLKRR
jgi:hypothetical protein